MLDCCLLMLLHILPEQLKLYVNIDRKSALVSGTRLSSDQLGIQRICTAKTLMHLQAHIAQPR